MPRKRYSIILANRVSGATHRFTVAVGPAVGALLAFLVLPIAVLIVSQWRTSHSVTELLGENVRLRIENSGYREATRDVTARMAGLDAAMSELSDRVDMDPELLQSMAQLPDDIQVGAPQTAHEASGQLKVLADLRGLLVELDDRLTFVRQGVAYREALADATPVIWPADGWISGTYGYRADPFTGERDFHPAVDISTQKGRPVYATATGRVLSAARNGAYGNLVEIDHGFELITRYGHLAEFAVSPGDTVKRGDLIGYVGATGRATGYHVHYEIWSNGRTVNPMQLLAETRSTPAN